MSSTRYLSSSRFTEKNSPQRYAKKFKAGKSGDLKYCIKLHKRDASFVYKELQLQGEIFLSCYIAMSTMILCLSQRRIPACTVFLEKEKKAYKLNLIAMENIQYIRAKKWRSL